MAQKWLRGTQTFQRQRDCNGGDRDLLVCHKSRLPLLGIKQQFRLVAPIQLKQRCKKWKILAENSTWNLSYTNDWAYFGVQQCTGGEVVEWLVLLPSFVCFPAKNVREPLLSVGFLWVLYFLPQFKCFASKVNWEMNPVHWWRKLGTGNWDDKPTYGTFLSSYRQLSLKEMLKKITWCGFERVKIMRSLLDNFKILKPRLCERGGEWFCRTEYRITNNQKHTKQSVLKWII